MEVKARILTTRGPKWLDACSLMQAKHHPVRMVYYSMQATAGVVGDDEGSVLVRLFIPIAVLGLPEMGGSAHPTIIAHGGQTI